MHGTIGRARNEGAANAKLGLDRKTGEILSAELRRGQRLPHLLRRRGDIDRVDDRGLEFCNVHRRYSSRLVLFQPSLQLAERDKLRALEFLDPAFPDLMDRNRIEVVQLL